MQITLSSPPEAADAHYGEILQELIERGRTLARLVEERAVKDPATDQTIAFERIARTLRRTIVLARHIATTPAQARATKTRERAKAREKIIRTIEDAIEVKGRHTKPFDAALHFDELNERMADYDLELDLQTRPLDDIIEEIARDLNVNAQERSWRHKRRTPTTLADLRARAAALPPLPPGLSDEIGEGRGEGNNQSSLEPGVLSVPKDGNQGWPSPSSG